MEAGTLRPIRPAPPIQTAYADELAHETTSRVSEALESRDVDQLLSCLLMLSRQHGMSEVARRLKIHRPLLYRMLRQGSNPKIGNIFMFFEIFGLKIQVVNEKPKAPSERRGTAS
jgi:DNA-binding phage protein